LRDVRQRDYTGYGIPETPFLFGCLPDGLVECAPEPDRRQCQGGVHLRSLRETVCRLSRPATEILFPRLLYCAQVRSVSAVNGQIIAYCSAMAQARRMLEKRLITRDEYTRIDRMMLGKYNLPVDSLYRDIRLLTGAVRANMSHHTEVTVCLEP
jgi:hypothetical protein